MSNVLIFLADGFEEVEALTVVNLLRRADIDITTVSIEDTMTVTGRSNITVEADKLIDDVDFDSADTIVLPGGMPGTKNLAACKVLMNHVDKYAEHGKRLCAICAAPTVYGKRGLLKGKRACCYPGMEQDLLDAVVTYDPVTVDGNFITSRGAGTAIDFALAIVKQIKGHTIAENISRSIVFK